VGYKMAGPEQTKSSSSESAKAEKPAKTEKRAKTEKSAKADKKPGSGIIPSPCMSSRMQDNVSFYLKVQFFHLSNFLSTDTGTT
jgi:hypothetical protein